MSPNEVRAETDREVLAVISALAKQLQGKIAAGDVSSYDIEHGCLSLARLVAAREGVPPVVSPTKQ